ncbi:ABC transporter substrate-binding protein [Hydrogenophaga sp.]|jgi:NitT/TauT family transport system substrate-binding protein|uniref:ABC transporter substrate-binding protein n=1 Tax=Hydrogenophaga sp. TaxID=1904254 RepID=UPI003F70EBAB
MFNKPLHRRDFGLVAAAATVGLATPAFAQTTRLRVSTIPIVDTAPLQVGMAKGFFTEQGLEIDTTPTAGGAAGLPALAAGQVQITFSNIISIVLGAKQGLGFQVVAAGAGTGDTPPDLAGIISIKGAPLKTGKDFEGKRIAVNTRNNVIWLFAREWVRATGGNPDNVTFLEVPFPQMTDAVRGGRVEGAFVVEPYLSNSINSENMQLVGWPYNTVMKRIPVGMYAATKSYIDQNPQVIERFVRGYNKAVDWTNANKTTDEWINIVAGYTRLPADRIKGLTVPPFDKTIDPARIDMVQGLMRNNALIDAPMSSSALLYRTATTLVS